jgi:cytochrome c oxidase cbb3-type subunit III
VIKTEQSIARPSPGVSGKASFFRQLVLLTIMLALVGLMFTIPPDSSLAQQHDRSAQSAASDSSVSGRKLFDGNCAGCHGLDARGGEHAPDIAGNPEFQRMSDEQLFRIVHDGAASLTMPAFSSILSDGKIKAVVAYLRSLQGRTGGARATLPGDPAAGQSVFFGKAACSQCHSLVESGAGSGGFIASDLTGYATGRDPAEILQAITRPNDNLTPRARSAVILTRDGRKFSGLIRNQDNFSVQLQSLDGTFHLLGRSELASITYEAQSLMPADYSQRLTPAELNDLVSFLMRAASAEPGAGRRAKRGHNGDDDDH